MNKPYECGHRCITTGTHSLDFLFSGLYRVLSSRSCPKKAEED